MQLQTLPAIVPDKANSLQRLESVEVQLLSSKLLNEIELQILRNERNSPAIRKLSPDEQFDALADVWSEVKVLTGAILRQGEELGIQVKVLHRFILSSPRLSSLTTSEILHAFYLNNAGEYGEVIKHYNQELNAEFVGGVLNAYLKKKVCFLREKHEKVQKLLNPPEAIQKPVYGPEDYKRWIQEDYEFYRYGNHAFITNTASKYLFLRRLNLIRYTSKNKFIQLKNEAFNQREHQKVYEAKTAVSKLITKAVYDSIRETKWIERNEYRGVIHTMRRNVYLKFFELIASCGINQIFTEIDY